MTTPTTVNVRLQLRADTAANWTAANPTLLANEVGLETDTKKLKVGNGSAAWNSLAYFPSIVSGGTVLGNLEIGSTGTLTFEGSTADGFETTLAVTNPTADRTITLPNVSGTVVTTGDTGSVTSTMIADGTIVNGDINASAAIAGTKISPDFGSQTVTTTGVVSAAAGAAATPSIAFTGDTNTGIYSPGADQVAISTGGSGRLFVDASGNVGAGTSSPASRLHVDDGFITTGRYGNLGALILRRANGTAAAPTQITSAASIGGVYARGRNELGAYNGVSSIGFGSDGAITSTSSPGFFVVETTPSSSTSPQERLRITSAGLVGVGTSVPAKKLEVTNGDIQIQNSDGAEPNTLSNYGLTFRAINQYGQDRGTIAEIKTYLATGSDNDFGLQFRTQATTAGGVTTKMTLTPGGSLGIGTTSPGDKLTVSDGIIRLSSTTSTSNIITFYDTTGLRHVIGSDATAGTNEFGLRTEGQIIFGAGSGRVEAARIDAFRRLLVGTSTSTTGVAFPSQIQSNAFYAYSASLFSADNIGSNTWFLKSRNATVNQHTAVQSGDVLGRINFAGSDGDEFIHAALIQAVVDNGAVGTAVSNNECPAALVFSTTADGASSPTERMRISNGGKIYANTTADPVGPSDVIIHAARTNGNAFGATVTTSGYTCYTVSSVTNGYAMWMYNTTASANVGSILINTASVSYTTTSDYRLKENVTTINDGITRLQQLKPSRFNFIADPDTTVDGFIAHEVQTVVPEAITGKKDAVDDDGNPIYQGIDQSKLVPLLTAALQEAIAKIESLEARLIAAGI